MSLQTDITTHLSANGVGTFGTDLYWGMMPDEPAELTSVYEMPGPAGVYAKDGAAGTEGRLQVLTRSEDYAVAMSKAMTAYTALDDMRTTLSGVRYSARALQRPFDVGAQDGQGRTIISCNYATYLRPS